MPDISQIIPRMKVASPAPIYELLENDQVFPAGMWRNRVNGDTYLIERATAVDWSTVTAALSLANDGSWTIPGNIAFKSGTAFNVTLDHAATADRVITIPDATDTMALLAAAQTLTSKTLTSPVINGTVTTTGLTMPAFEFSGDLVPSTDNARSIGSTTKGQIGRAHV